MQERRAARPRARRAPGLEDRTVDELAIDDEGSLRRVALYAGLKDVLRRDGYVFRVLPRASARWDRALFLNLTYWGGAGGDVLDGPRVPADVVAHAAWHHLAARALPARGGRRTAAELFLGESIASAFDAYLVGRLLARAPRSPSLRAQVAAMGDAARAAGLSAARFEALLGWMAARPERAFAELRELLWDATRALWRCRDAGGAARVLARLDARRLAPLLHHYEVSNWILYARAYARPAAREDRRARAVDAALRRAADPLAWLAARWIAPALAR